MNFDPENRIHLENVDENYAHLDILDAINREAFPSAERADITRLASFPDRQLLHLNAIVDGEIPVGFMIWLEPDEEFAYLTYIAIDARYRNRKYGSKTFALLFNEILKGKISIGSMEALDPAAKNYEQRLKRKKLYERIGFTIFDDFIVGPNDVVFQIMYYGPETPKETIMKKLDQVFDIMKKCFSV